MRSSIYHSNAPSREVACDRWFALVKEIGVDGVIFDCDGTLVDSEKYHFAAFSRALARQGAVLDPDWYYARTGLDRRGTLLEFTRDAAVDLDLEQAITDSIAAFVALSPSVTAIPQTAALVRRLDGVLPMAVGTNGEREVAEASLSATGLRAAFAAVISISDPVRPKPAPDIFVLAAQRLGLDPARVLVFEDSAQGVKAAQNAGMAVVQIRP